MNKIATDFEGLFIIKHNVFHDDRGSFTKTYNKTAFEEMDLDILIKERYFSVSSKNVLRGMHFQTPPYDHVKLVTVMQGSILDVVLDIRIQSNTFGQSFSKVLKADEGKTLLIPKGFAHGFLALEDNTIVEYNQSTEYAPNNDEGLHYGSIGFNWGIDKPIVSGRDLSFSTFANYKSPF